MELFPTLERQSQESGLQFLVIGGLAVNFYGYSRDTADLDLLVCRDDRPAWLRLFAGSGYSVEHDADTFVQLSPPAQGDWPVDLMFVRKPTFTAMIEARREVEIFGCRLSIPALDHLIALKLHALKHTRPHRFLKDFQDVEGLLLVNHLDPRSEKVRQLFQKYGTVELHEKIVRACSQG